MRLIVLLLVGLMLAGCDRQKPDAPQASAASGGITKGIDRSHKGEQAPAAAFADRDGRTTDIGDFTGRPVLVNLWATWCGPCIKELPTLGIVASEENKSGLAVIAVSQDSGNQSEVTRFLDDKKIDRFAAYHDPDMALSTALEVQVMPTTILYDAAGMEVWRFTGDMDWTSPDARKLLAEARS